MCYNFYVKSCRCVIPKLSLLRNTDNQEHTVIANIWLKIAPLVNLDQEWRVEELAWFYLLPDGSNSFGENQDIPVMTLYISKVER